MAAQRKYPDELRERAVKMVLEIRELDGKGHGEISSPPRTLRRRISAVARSAMTAGTISLAPAGASSAPGADRARCNTRRTDPGHVQVSRPAISIRSVTSARTVCTQRPAYATAAATVRRTA